MERKYLICMLVGKITEWKNDVSGEDLRYYIDERLEKCCLPLLGHDPEDDNLLNELLGETMIYVMGQGINRKTRRS